MSAAAPFDPRRLPLQDAAAGVPSAPGELSSPPVGPDKPFRERLIERVGLIRTIVAAAVVLVSGTAGAVSVVTLNRLTKIEAKVALHDRQMAYVAWSLYFLAQGKPEAVEKPSFPLNPEP